MLLAVLWGSVELTWTLFVGAPKPPAIGTDCESALRLKWLLLSLVTIFRALKRPKTATYNIILCGLCDGGCRRRRETIFLKPFFKLGS